MCSGNLVTETRLIIQVPRLLSWFYRVVSQFSFNHGKSVFAKVLKLFNCVSACMILFADVAFLKIN